MPRLLIVEDSRTFSQMLARRVTGELGFEVVVASSRAAAEALLARDADFFAALLDINLPDAPQGEVVDLVLAHGIPSIVFTGEMDDALRERFWSKHIVDYVLKQNMENVQYMLALVERLYKNPGIPVLVVDDSRSARHMVAGLLRAHRYEVLEAGDGNEALAQVAARPDLKLVITDFNMPGMDGFELTRQIRRDHPKDSLAIIGLSGAGEAPISARFLKSGANDFLRKPFLTEEFYTRVTQNLELLEHIERIKDLANKDFLTRLFNRRHFFTAGERALAALRKAGRPVALAMLDIDHFKSVNDTHGHDAGDMVLRHLAAVLSSRFGPECILARLGGEEFCVLAPGLAPDAALDCFEGLRKAIEASPARCAGVDIPFTASLGVCCRALPSLDEMVREADRALYASKNAGRNRVTLA